MSNSKNKNLPWLLVTTSMILLLIFVTYWNISEYNAEKQQLSQDVENQLQLAYTEVKDSFIADELTYFVQARLGDSLSVDMDSISLQITKTGKTPMPGFLSSETYFEEHTIEKGSDTLIIFDIEQRWPEWKNKKRDSTVSNQLKSKNTTDRFPNFRLFTDSNNVTKWIKSDSLLPHRFGLDPTYKREFTFESEPSLLLNKVLSGSINRNEKTYEQFDKNLLKNNLPTQYDIVENQNSAPHGLRVKHISKSFGQTEWVVDIKNYIPHILLKILPTLLFSLFLLSIVGLAFWTLINNWLKQQQLVKVKNEFINNMTHELKTPIATMGVALEAISKFDVTKEEAKTQEYIDISRNEVNRLSLLVDKVLNMAIFDNDSSEITKSEVDLSQIVQQVLSSMKLQFEQTDTTINIDGMDQPLIIHGDAVHLTNVIYNLIDNAIKYSPQKPIITIDAKVINDVYSLSIRDNGKGISKENLSKVFDRFYRVPSGDRHEVKGHGLGLSYVKDVILKHGGNIEVDSNPNLGTIFTLSFPKSKPHV